MSLPTPNFIERDPQTIIDDMVRDYENRTGKRLEPAQAERLLINSFAYRESLIRSQIQDAALQNLVAYSRYPILDYLGELVGVTRLPAAAAGSDMEFTLVSGHTGVVIPEGMRIQTSDGKVVFQVIEPVTVAPGVTTATGSVIAQQGGLSGSGYVAGTIVDILDPQPFIASATNTTTSVGGSEQETDEELRERIKLAPSSFSVAGPKGAYDFFARSAHPSITDVGVLSSVPGTVEIYPLSNLGIPTPTPVLEAVEIALNDERVRPLSDTVVVESPTHIDYDITVELTLLNTAPVSETETQVTEALIAYAAQKQSSLGQDIVRDQITRESMLSGVYKINIVSPAADIVIEENEVPVIGTITVSTVSTVDG